MIVFFFAVGPAETPGEPRADDDLSIVLRTTAPDQGSGVPTWKHAAGASGPNVRRAGRAVSEG